MFEKGVILKPWSLIFTFFLLTFYSYPIVLEVTIMYFLSMTGAAVLIGGATFYYFAFRAKYITPKLHRKEGQDFSLRLLTYNIFLRPPLIKTNQSDHKELRLGLFENYLVDYDVILFQEMFELGSSRQNRLWKMARKSGFKYFHKSVPPSLFSRKFIDAGLMIVSRFPILETDAHIYTKGNQIDEYAAKQMIYAKIDISGTNSESAALHVFTTHMQASYNENEHAINKINDSARLSQVYEVSAFVGSCLKKHSISSDTVIVAGDFNIDAHCDSLDFITESPEYLTLIEELRRADGTREVHDCVMDTYGEHIPTYGVLKEENGEMVPADTVLTSAQDYGIQQCIDYIFHLKHPENKTFLPRNTKVEEFLVEGKSVTQCSDHYGISTEF